MSCPVFCLLNGGVVKFTPGVQCHCSLPVIVGYFSLVLVSRILTHLLQTGMHPKSTFLLPTYNPVRSRTPHAFLDPPKMLKMSRKLL